MFGWCDKCHTVTIEGLCTEHGATQPLEHVNAVDVHPLSTFEKSLFNERMHDLKLGDGFFIIYSDRTFRKKVITLDVPIAEVKLVKNEIILTPLTSGEIKGIQVSDFAHANSNRLDRLITTTKGFVEWELDKAKNAIVSFSGGKDSIVVGDILDNYGIPKVFIDTRLEFPETYDFIKNAGNGKPIDITRAKSDFFPLCKEKGFPKHGYRWCCKTQKFEPFRRYLDEKYGTDDVSVFTGERRWEGLYRIQQPFKKTHKHIPTQQTIQPILDWFALDIWNYIWSKDIPWNRVYDNFDRAGCWLCPFGLEYRVHLLQFTHPKLYDALEKFGGVSKRASRKQVITEDEKPPCTMELDGEVVKTCDVYGHFFTNGACFRCGEKDQSTIEVSPSLVG